MVGIGIIGYGYWGPNLLRNFYTAANTKVIAVSDARQERLDMVKKLYPSIHLITDSDELLANDEIDAIVIATPVFSHFDLAKQALLKGKHVLLEKPMTSTVAEAKELIALAKEKNLVLMVDHTFLYTSAVQKIKSLKESGEIGDLQYFDSTRINLGLFQSDINVLWDLAPHDISILLHLVDEKPVSVNATGISHTFNGLENIAYLTVNYASSFVAHFSCSWSSPVKIRTILVGGSKKMILFNDVEPTEKIKIYDTGVEVKEDEEKHKLLVDYRVGDVFIPKLANSEALGGMAKDFISAIAEGKSPVSDASLGLEVIKILEAAQLSIRNNGREEKIVA